METVLLSDFYRTQYFFPVNRSQNLSQMTTVSEVHLVLSAMLAAVLGFFCVLLLTLALLCACGYGDLLCWGVRAICCNCTGPPVSEDRSTTTPHTTSSKDLPPSYHALFPNRWKSRRSSVSVVQTMFYQVFAEICCQE